MNALDPPSSRLVDEVDEQQRVVDDDASEGDHAEERHEGQRLAQNEEAEDDADQTEWDREENHEGLREALEDGAEDRIHDEQRVDERGEERRQALHRLFGLAAEDQVVAGIPNAEVRELRRHHAVGLDRRDDVAIDIGAHGDDAFPVDAVDPAQAGGAPQRCNVAEGHQVAAGRGNSQRRDVIDAAPVLRQVAHSNVDVLVVLLHGRDDRTVARRPNGATDAVDRQVVESGSCLVDLDANLVLAGLEAVGNIVDAVDTA